MLEKLEHLPDRHFFWLDRKQPHRAILVRADDLPRPHESVGLSEKDLDTFIDDCGLRKGGAGLSKETLHGQIDARAERLKQLKRPPIRLRLQQDASNPEPAEDPPILDDEYDEEEPRIG